MSMALQERATFPPPAKGRGRQIAEGSASDIWVVTRPDSSTQRVWKVPRINPARFTRHVSKDLSNRSWESISHSGLTFGLDTKKFTIKKPSRTTRTPVATVSKSGDRTVDHRSIGSSSPSSQGDSHLWGEFLRTYCDNVDTWTSLNHENVVRVFGFGEGLNLEVEYYENGVSATCEISLLALNAGKMFVDRYGRTLVGEFSLSTLFHPLSEHVPDISFAGSSRWFSPELLENPTAQFTEKSDIWALGCTLYEILAEKIPYSSQRHEIKAQREILNGALPGGLELDISHSSTTVHLWPIIESCWAPDAANRPAASELAVQVAHLITVSYTSTDRLEAVGDVIRSNMSMAEVVEILGRHGCPDLTQQIDFSTATLVTGGGYGDIYRAETMDGTGVALKINKYGRVDHLKRTARELYIWSLCDHQRVAKLLGLAIFNNTIAMVSRWMTHGTVMNYISRHGNVDPVQLCVEVSEGFVYLHQEGIIYGAGKGQNVLVSEHGSALLTDFGEAELIYPGTTLSFTRPSSPGGITLRWAAPELLQGEQDHPSTSADVYALGMTILVGAFCFVSSTY
ncbi:Tyrosine kinase catalytic domain protein [Ceratobasidium sp. AG-Ba]|nr:Tyrosine kinase catalytic domain protein [Ceratobasidium sp. AG-Ba]